jgi:hypothetical protein
MNYLFCLLIGIAFMPYCLNAQTKYVENRTILGAEVQVFRLPKTDKKFQKDKYFWLIYLQDDLIGINEAVSQNKKKSWQYDKLNDNEKFEDEILSLKKEFGKTYPFDLWEAEWAIYQKYFDKVEQEAQEKREAKYMAEAQVLAQRARSLCDRPLYDTLWSSDLEIIAQTLENRYLKDSTELRLCMTNKKKANEDAHKQRAENSRRYHEQEAKNAEAHEKKAELERLSDDDLHKISIGTSSTKSRLSSSDALDEMRKRRITREREAARRRRSSTRSRSRR